MKILLTMLIVLITLTAQARIGETEEQCRKRYGTAVNVEKTTDGSPRITFIKKLGEVRLHTIVVFHKEKAAILIATATNSYGFDENLKLLLQILEVNGAKFESLTMDDADELNQTEMHSNTNRLVRIRSEYVTHDSGVTEEHIREVIIMDRAYLDMSVAEDEKANDAAVENSGL